MVQWYFINYPIKLLTVFFNVFILLLHTNCAVILEQLPNRFSYCVFQCSFCPSTQIVQWYLNNYLSNLFAGAFEERDHEPIPPKIPIASHATGATRLGKRLISLGNPCHT